MDKVENPQRLCSEIQLFDLCDRDDCQFKKGRYCTNQDILARFEAISDDEDANSTEQFLVDEMDEIIARLFFRMDREFLHGIPQGSGFRIMIRNEKNTRR